MGAYKLSSSKFSSRTQFNSILAGNNRFLIPKATGGTISYDGAYVVHTFLSSGTFTSDATLTSVDYLVVAGAGGGGGGNGGGGGGAGGFKTGASFTIAASTAHTVTIGAGGAAQTDGNNSVFSTITSLITSLIIELPDGVSPYFNKENPLLKVS